MKEILFIVFIAKTVDNYASRGWIFKHFENTKSAKYDIKIFECEPKTDKGLPLEIFIKKEKSSYKIIYLISTNTDNHNNYVNWILIKKLITKVIVFPVDAISVLKKFKNSIVNIADLVWCPHVQKLDELDQFNKPYIYLPYASDLPKKIIPYEKRSNALFFQGNAHGLRKSLVKSLANKSKVKIEVQGKGWGNNEKNNLKYQSISKSLNYFFKGSKRDIFKKIILETFTNKYFLKSVFNYPNRLLKEKVKIKNDNFNVLTQNNQKTLDEYKYTLGINFLFSNPNNFSYRLRDFEAPASGTCHFTQSDPNLEGIFLPNKSMLYYKDCTDLTDLIKYYLLSADGQAKAIEIARNAREIAKKNTWNSRLEKIINFFEN